jgi:hypothetical protein
MEAGVFDFIVPPLSDADFQFVTDSAATHVVACRNKLASGV